VWFDLDWGNEAAPPMLLLHGFTGYAHPWDTFASAMREHFHVLALDQCGHGDSDWAKDGAYLDHRMTFSLLLITSCVRARSHCE
jgi:pimeloyl-ACP methyl ester carboxylesterase